MPSPRPLTGSTTRLLIKLRPTRSLKSAQSRMHLRPLFEPAQTRTMVQGLAAQPQWFLAEMPEPQTRPWDVAHQRIADQIGVLPSELLFVEPDLYHTIFPETEQATAPLHAIGRKCTADEQDSSHGKAVGPDIFSWHLGSDFTGLENACNAVQFTARRTRIAHLDTGYYRAHDSAPEYVLSNLEKNFVSGDADPHSAEDPDNAHLIDSSGHGTGTLGILAGGKVPAFGDRTIGGAPDAEVLPLRVADSVVLLRTSALARALDYAVYQECDVATLSMGGWPSQVWSETVDKAYEAGLCICAAAGNHIGGLPPVTLVYPARYSRVIAVCGVMADHQPYADLSGMTLQGCFGPASVMGSAMAAYTPNIAWARFECKDGVRLNGQGTSAATPQVAAAAAIWLEKYKNDLRRDWRRVEAVRHALFKSAKLKNKKKYFGHGVLQAHAALEIRPLTGLPKSGRCDHSFAFLRLITGIGLDQIPPREAMFNLELAQRWLVNPALQKIVADPESRTALKTEELRRCMAAIIEDDGASLALRRHVAQRYPAAVGRRTTDLKASPEVTPKALPACEKQPEPADPAHRRIRVYAMDPSFAAGLDTADINEMTMNIRWEPLAKGPIGEYLTVEDLDAAGRHLNPVDLDDPRLLAQDGWAPSEDNPQFHQQMVYAVAMKTIEHFERALGRPILWRPRRQGNDTAIQDRNHQRLLIRPHALWEPNAFYSPQQVALLFGYFEADAEHPGEQMPGSRIYTCLSHDIIAHETAHAILDGMHGRFAEATNPDVPAFHEAFADIVALLQHFTIPEVLRHEISRTRGDLEAESLLGKLAVQFGRATGRRDALRQAIGRLRDGRWERLTADPADLQRIWTPHARGAILVAAVFDAFIAIYKTRIADLLRIYTGGTGVLPSGAIHPDLAGRLTAEATKSAGHVLTICIRALDYLPPVDVTFFEYLRAIITADSDLVSDDRLNYRVAFVEAFRRRGIYPFNLKQPTADTPRTFSVESLRWQSIDHQPAKHTRQHTIQSQFAAVIADLKQYADACLYLTDREKLFSATEQQRRRLKDRLGRLFRATAPFAAALGVDAAQDFEVLDLRRAMRISPDGRYIPQIVIALAQSKTITAADQDQSLSFSFRGGSTLVIDLAVPAVAYCIFKRIGSETRQKRTAQFIQKMRADPLYGLYFAMERTEPFAVLHALA